MRLSNIQFGDLIPKLEKLHNEDFRMPVNAFAHGTEEDPMAEWSQGPDNLPVSHTKVPLSELPDYPTDSDNPRVTRAEQGYRTSPSPVPSVLLVQRAGSYEIADGHHRIRAARNVGKKDINAWVVHSPNTEPHPGFDNY